MGRHEVKQCEGYGRCLAFSTYYRWYNYSYLGEVVFSEVSTRTMAYWVQQNGLCSEKNRNACDDGPVGAHPFEKQLQQKVVPDVIEQALHEDPKTNQLSLFKDWDHVQDLYSPLPGWGYYRVHESHRQICISVACEGERCKHVHDFETPKIIVHLAEIGEAGVPMCPPTDTDTWWDSYVGNPLKDEL